MPETQSVIQTIAQFAYTVLVTLVPILIVYFVPRLTAWAEAKAQQAKSEMTAGHWELIQEAARWAATTVEQLRKSGVIPDNKSALNAACDIAARWLDSRGIRLDKSELVAAIESAVGNLPSKAAK